MADLSSTGDGVVDGTAKKVLSLLVIPGDPLS